MRQSACRPQYSQVSGYSRGLTTERPARKASARFFDVEFPLGKLLRVKRLFYQICVSSEIRAQSRFGIADFSGEFRFAGADFGEDEAADLVCIAMESEVGIKRQLHIVGAREIPGVWRGVAGFVIDDEKRIVDEAIDAIEAHAKRQAGDGDTGFLFRVEHREGNARSLEVKPLGDEIEEASLFERKVAWRHGFPRAKGHCGWMAPRT